MTGDGKPQVTRKVKTEQTVHLNLTLSQIHKIFRDWLRKTYPEFRGFADQEFKFEFVDLSLDKEMTLEIKAWKETND